MAGVFKRDKGKKTIHVKVSNVKEDIKAEKELIKLQNRQYKIAKKRINRTYRNEVGFPLLRIVLLILIISSVIAFLRFGNADNAFTFESLLNFLQNVPQVDFDWLNIAQVDFELPGWLDWLDDIVNFMSSLVEFLGFILAGLWQALTFMLYFLRYLFVS